MVPVMFLPQDRRYLEVTLLGEGEVSDGTVTISHPVAIGGDVCAERWRSLKSGLLHYFHESSFRAIPGLIRSRKDWMLQGILV